MSIRLPLVLSLAALALALSATDARAGEIELKNGRRIENCWVIEESNARIVVAVIRGGNVGKIVLNPVDVQRIDRTVTEPLEVALARAREEWEREQRVRAEEERARAAAAAAAAEREAGAGTPGADRGGSAEDAIRKTKFSDLVGPITPEEEARIAELIRGIGDVRATGGAGGRRERALTDLVQVGPKAIPAVTGALSDDTSYRRMNAARALADLARQDPRLPLYEEAIPKLISMLNDPQIWVRVAANHALQAISGQDMGFPEPQGEELMPEELAAIDRWGKWWEATRPLIGLQ